MNRMLRYYFYFFVPFLYKCDVYFLLQVLPFFVYFFKCISISPPQGDGYGWNAIFFNRSSNLKSAFLLSCNDYFDLFFDRNAYEIIYFLIIPGTSAVRSTNLGSILTFASCVVGTCNILCG